MTVAELDAAWRVGVEAIETARHDGIRVVALGEMGIGNTTPAACITSLLTGRSAEAVTGTGAGVASGGHARKIGIVSAAVERAGRLDATDRRAALASVAGLEVAALAGAIAAGARAGVTVLLDGFIVAAAALMAEALAPGSTRSVIAAHAGSEPGHRIALTHLGLEPFLEWDLRLGEGTGALLLLPLVDSAAAILKDVARLDELGGP